MGTQKSRRKKFVEDYLKVKKVNLNESIKFEDQLLKSICISPENFQKQSEYFCWVTAFTIFFLLQTFVSVTNYSGFANPPIYGDFEAQRHWMEITINLPISQWYVNSTSNDLNYWGLDYPPLTAYHSWIMGKIAKTINSSWTELPGSRGIETQQHKLFMRLTVIFTMTLLYAPAIFILITPRNKNSIEFNFKLLLAILCYPGLIFVDNGHFQYNHVALGLFLLSIYSFKNSHFKFGAFLFVLALNFKQTSLFYALPIFVFLLSKFCWPKNQSNFMAKIFVSFLNILKMGMVVLATFGILWAPFLLTGGIHLCGQVLRRIFPIARGVFEDKVANFWCCANVFIKYKGIYSNEFLAILSTLLVFISLVPSLFTLLKRPTERNFHMTLLISSLSFYLFSFQVHEKAILMVSIPALLLLDDMPYAVSEFLSVSLISLYPLCLKDDVGEILPLFIMYSVFLKCLQPTKSEFFTLKFLQWFNFVIGVLLCFAHLLIEPPIKRYPHLWEVLNALYSFANFTLFWIFANFQLLWSNFFVCEKYKTA